MYSFTFYNRDQFAQTLFCNIHIAICKGFLLLFYFKAYVEKPNIITLVIYYSMTVFQLDRKMDLSVFCLTHCC